MINLSLCQANYSRFMIVSVKSDSSINRRFCNFKNASLRDTDIDDSVSIQLFGRLKSDNRWYPIDYFYNISYNLSSYIAPVTWI